MSFIGIDLGTTFIKGAILDLETRQLHHVRRTPFPSQLENTAPLACEFDPDEILTAVRTLLAELAPYAPACEGVVMCAQMHGMDRQAHRLLTAGNDDVGITGGDLLHAKRHRPEPGAAELIDRPRRGPPGQACADRRLAGRVLPFSRGENLAEDHLVDLGRLEPRRSCHPG